MPPPCRLLPLAGPLLGLVQGWLLLPGLLPCAQVGSSCKRCGWGAGSRGEVNRHMPIGGSMPGSLSGCWCWCCWCCCWRGWQWPSTNVTAAASPSSCCAVPSCAWAADSSCWALLPSSCPAGAAGACTPRPRHDRAPQYDKFMPTCCAAPAVLLTDGRRQLHRSYTRLAQLSMDCQVGTHQHRHSGSFNSCQQGQRVVSCLGSSRVQTNANRNLLRGIHFVRHVCNF